MNSENDAITSSDAATVFSIAVSLIPHGLLRGDIYRLVQLCLVAQQQASNESKGIEDAAVKLWSSAAPPNHSYLLHARPEGQANKDPAALRQYYHVFFK